MVQFQEGNVVTVWGASGPKLEARILSRTRQAALGGSAREYTTMANASSRCQVMSRPTVSFGYPSCPERVGETIGAAGKAITIAFPSGSDTVGLGYLYPQALDTGPLSRTLTDCTTSPGF